MANPKHFRSGGWEDTTEAEEAELQQKFEQELARLNAIPEYKKHQNDKVWICNFLSELLYVDAHEFTVSPPPFPSHVAYRMARVELTSQKPLTYDADGYQTQEYRHFTQQRQSFNSALRHYVQYFRTSQWDNSTYVRAEAEAYLGRYTMDVLRQGFKRASAPYDVGSSLYIYQQMYDRQLSQSPALSRAAWLVKNAPLRKPVPEKPTPRGKWQRIQEQWKDHFDDSHFWAALVTTTKSPLQLNENLLFDFICDVNVDQLTQIANTFWDFRQRVKPPKISAKNPMYLKQGLSEFKIDQTRRISPLEIPNLLEDFQWAALSRYPQKIRDVVLITEHPPKR